MGKIIDETVKVIAMFHQGKSQNDVAMESELCLTTINRIHTSCVAQGMFKPAKMGRRKDITKRFERAALKAGIEVNEFCDMVLRRWQYRQNYLISKEKNG